MNKKYWQQLATIFDTHSELAEEYKDLAKVVDLVNTDINLQSTRDEVSKELQELNKEEKEN